MDKAQLDALKKMFYHAPLLAKPYDGQPVRYLHDKLDGHRVTILIQPTGKIVCRTRNQTNLYPDLVDKAKNNNIWDWIVSFNGLPRKTSIDGELYVPGEPGSYIKTAIKRNDPNLKFIAFAVPWYGGVALYKNPLQDALRLCTLNQIDFAPFVDLERFEPIDVQEWLEKLPPEVEGYVLKESNYCGWYKIKRTETLDAFITGFIPGQGKYLGMIGSLICSVYGRNNEPVEICTCSGMTDEQRASIAQKDIGRVIEIKYQKVGALGRLQHPNFKCWRDDKAPEDCTVSQDLALLRYWMDNDR